MVRRIGIVFFVVFVLAAAFGGIVLREGSGPGPDVVIHILSPHWEGIRHEFDRGFAEYYREKTGDEAAIEWIDQGGTSDIVRYIKNEFERSPGGIEADLFFGGGVESYIDFAGKGLLEPYRLPAKLIRGLPRSLAGIPVYDKEHRWYGTCFSGFGIVYNTEVSRRMKFPPVSEWEDLANPRLKGWVASGDSRSSGSVHMMYEIILQAYGFEKGYGVICRMAGNVRAFNQGGSSVPRDVGLAEVYCGPSIDFYAWEQVATHGHENVGYAMPKGLTVIGADPVAILKGAPQLSAAKHFVDFVMSESGQKLWYLKKGAEGGPRKFSLNRMPVRRSLYTADAETGVRYSPYDWEGGFTYDAAKASRRWVIINDLFKASIYDVHPELKAAWSALDAATLPPDALREFERSPASEEELELLARGGYDSKRRNESMALWTVAAREKFRKVIEACEQSPGGN